MLPGKKYTPEDLLAIAWRRRWTIIVPFLLVAATTAGVSLLLPNKYRSETLVFVVPQRVPESYVRSTVTARIEDRVQSIREQILSRTRLERIIEELSLFTAERQKRPMEDIIDAMRMNVGTRVVREDAFSVSFVATDPVVAQKVTERLAGLFSEENMRDREVLADSTNQFLQTQLEEARQRLQAHEKRVEEFRRQYAGQLPDQVNFNLQAIQNKEMQIQALVQGLSQDRDRRLFVERQLAEAINSEEPVAAPPPPAPAGVPQRVTPAQLLEQAEAQLKGLEARLTPEHPDVVRATAEVARLRAQVPRPTDAGPDGPRVVSTADTPRNIRIRDLRGQLEALDRQIAQKVETEQQLRGVVGEYQAKVQAVPTREAEMIALTRDYETLQRQYRSLLEKYEESKVAANLVRRQIGEQFRILDPARVPGRPFTPNRLMINAAGAAGGLALGIILVAFLEYRDRTFRSPQEIASCLSLPVLAALQTVSTVEERKVATRRRRRMGFAIGGLSVAVLAVLILARIVFKVHL